VENARVLGDNIKLLLTQRGIEKDAFAKEMGYSLLDVEKLCDARLFVTGEDVRGIADYFSVDPQYLYTRQDDEQYVGRDFLHCMGQFKKPENREKILDIFDMYCDVKEALEK
jgi:hypothetical protein